MKMKNKNKMKWPLLLPVLGLLVGGACSDFYEGEFSSGESSYGSFGSPNGGDSINVQAGLVTAGEWNDLDHWDFWCELLANQDDSTEYYTYPIYWRYNTANRIGLKLNHSGKALINAEVVLKQGEDVCWKSRTDNLGRAELWLSDEDSIKTFDIHQYQLYVNGILLDDSLKMNEVNEFDVAALSSESNRVELAFIVDATGSMGDEMAFLKKDLSNVIERVKDENTSLNIYTAALFYRDEGDDYVTRYSDFTNQLDKTIKYIGKQKASGGGDYPESVHTAMKKALNDLQWSDEARTRIAFMLLDAPPHYEDQVLDEIHRSVKAFAAKGVKLIPISASGIEKSTEFLLRYFAIATNGTYVFITDDSQIGNPHIKPSVGNYEVEHLNDLMIRLIKKYTD